MVLGTFAESGLLAAGGSYAQAENVTLPAGLAAGTYNIFVSVDAFNQVAEPGAEGNNVGLSQTPLLVASLIWRLVLAV